MAKNFNIEEFVNEFKERSGFGVIGSELDGITAYLNERVPEENVRINLPYYNFNVRGRVADVHRDVYGVMPFTYLYGDRSKVVDQADTTTLFYGDCRTDRTSHLPFLSDCDVFFVDNCEIVDGTIVINLKKGPNWRTYL